jgi:hypothetical protein
MVGAVTANTRQPMGRKTPFVVVLTEAERCELEGRVRRASAEHRAVLRAQIVLLLPTARRTDCRLVARHRGEHRVQVAQAVRSRGAGRLGSRLPAATVAADMNDRLRIRGWHAFNPRVPSPYYYYKPFANWTTSLPAGKAADALLQAVSRREWSLTATVEPPGFGRPGC